MTICGDEALCRPLGSAGSHLHHMPRPADEVVAFPSYELYGAGVNGTEERNYDWSKITSVAPFEPMGRWKVGDRAFGEVYCEAHRVGAKMLAWNQPGWNNTACAVSHVYDLWRHADPQMYNATHIAAWATETAECLAATGWDGVLFDAEVTPPDGAKGRAAVTMAVCALKRALQITIPGAPVYFAVGAGVASFDFADMSEKQQCVDMWMIMDYCLCRALAGNLRANADIRVIDGVKQHYTQFGVPMAHVGVIFPWFGCDFACVGGDPACPTVAIAHTTHSEFPADDPSHPGSLSGCGYGEWDNAGIAEVVEFLAPNNTAPDKGWLLDEPTMTRHFIWRNGSGALHDIWFDDRE